MISYRLKSLAKYIDKDDHIIDIGCDHALLDIYLVKENFIEKIIVSDIHEGALLSGKENIKKANFEKKIDARLGNGLEVLKENDKIDTILISGMGTNTILDILKKENIDNIKKLVLQSNNDHYLLRKEIIKLGFYINNEEYFVDNKKNYINIVFIKGKRRYKENELKYGPFLSKDENYLNFEISNIDKIYNLIPKNKKLLKYKLKREKKKIKKLLKVS